VLLHIQLLRKTEAGERCVEGKIYLILLILYQVFFYNKYLASHAREMHKQMEMFFQKLSLPSDFNQSLNASTQFRKYNNTKRCKYFFSGFRFVVWEQTDRNMKKLVNECLHIFFTDTPPKYTVFTLLTILVTAQGKLIIQIIFQLQIIKKQLTITKRSMSALPATIQALELCVQIPLSACLHACLLSSCCPVQLLDFRYCNLPQRVLQIL
jgi:hypothetical protein